ncbi:MAG: hypothetical protein K0R38_4597 [Polyangiaceae bacterium]|nr:hypothetical protein [Polyangiaceae bacterium]
MKSSKVLWSGLSLLSVLAMASCDRHDDAGTSPGTSGSAGSGNAAGAVSGGSGGSTVGGAAGTAGASNGGGGTSTGGTSPTEGGAGGVNEGGGPGAGGGGEVPAECGDPSRDGVLVFQDITAETTWSCPVYTLTQPIYVHSTSDVRTVLHIEPGVTVRGLKGKEPIKLPGALIVTRTGRLDAVGEPDQPITFTTAEPPADRGPGAWGGLVLLGRAPVNAPANFEDGGLPAGEVYAEALPKSELGVYGSAPDAVGGAGGSGGAAPEEPEPADWDCGTLKYVRVFFAGFKAGSTKELNGITLAGCGTKTSLDYVQVHRSSDDGIEVFGGAPNLSHLVLTGNQDDQFDWDQGFRGKAQFVAIQVYDDADTADSCGIEADGYATPTAPAGLPSAPRIWNLTLKASKVTQRGIRFRDGTQGFVGNAVLTSHAEGVPKGLIDIDLPLTADYLVAGTLAVRNTVLRGVWPTSGQADTQGTVILEQDYFTGSGPGAAGNTAVTTASELWVDPFNIAAPDWVPLAASAAAEGGVAPSDVDGSSFFDTTATYRGAFAPGGLDWTVGWASYP